jgi:thermostable 8-oxoguanine DNA glycosylase
MGELSRTLPRVPVFDEAKALKRIANRSRDFYGVRSIEDLRLSEADFVLAATLHEQESQIIFNGEPTLTNEGLFRGIAYCVLTPMQDFYGQEKGFNAMFNKDFEPIEANLFAEQALVAALRKAKVNYYASKSKYVLGVRKRLGELDLAKVIQDQIGTSWQNEAALRLLICKGIKGLGAKTTSLLLRMCGAQFLVPIDSWMVEMLYLHGYPCSMPRTTVQREGSSGILNNKERKRGLTYNQHLHVEEYALDLAQKYDVPGYLLQLAFYTKNSTYNAELQRKRQLVFEYDDPS